MTIDYKEKYIASRDELRVQTKSLQLCRRRPTLKKQLEKAAKPKKTREATPRNKEIGIHPRSEGAATGTHKRSSDDGGQPTDSTKGGRRRFQRRSRTRPICPICPSDLPRR
jgi:hypothetical protein